MKLSGFKYLFVLVCLFSIMEKTGTSALSFFSHIKVLVTEQQAEKQANESSENSEAKQVEVKEYWAVHPNVNLSLHYLNFKPVRYPQETSQHHHNWCPPVPTPPPSTIV